LPIRDRLGDVPRRGLAPHGDARSADGQPLHHAADVDLDRVRRWRARRRQAVDRATHREGHRPGLRPVVLPVSHVMRSFTRPLFAPLLLASSAALAQSHVRLSYEFAVPRGDTQDFVDRFSSRGAHLDVSLELSYAFHLELSAGLNSFNAVKQGVLSTTDGDVS